MNTIDLHDFFLDPSGIEFKLSLCGRGMICKKAKNCNCTRCCLAKRFEIYEEGLKMGNRAECPVCKSYTSSVYHALNYEMGCCPTCQAPYDVLRQWNNLKEELEALQQKRVEKDILQQIKDVHEENAILKTKLSRLENVLGYDDTIVKPILEAIKILNNQDDEDVDEDPHGYNFPHRTPY